MTPPVGPEVISTIRARARFLRRRRQAGYGLTAVLVAGAISVPLVRSSPAVRTVEVASGTECPADSVAVYVRVGDSARVGSVPKGWALVQGQPNQSEAAMFYADPSQWVQSRRLSQEYQQEYWIPSVELLVNFPSANPSSNVAGGPSIGGPRIPNRTATTEIHGSKATISYFSLGHQIGATSDPTMETVTWNPASGVTVTVTADDLPDRQVQSLARSVSWQAGKIVQLPDAARYRVTAEAAALEMPAAQRPTTKAVLTTWAEVDRTAYLSGPGLVDYRAVWLVYSGSGGTGRDDWKVIDADTGNVLQSAADSSAPWITSVSDRSRPGCEPPLGALTRSEISRFELPGATFLLTTLAQADSATKIANGSISRADCDGECDPLVWLAIAPGGRQADILDAVTGANLGGSIPPPANLPADLDQG